MFDVRDYINKILKVKGWSRSKLCREMNKLEDKLGDRHTRVQNITNYLNGYHKMRPKWLLKVEKVLELEPGELALKVEMPKTKDGVLEVKRCMEKINKVR